MKKIMILLSTYNGEKYLAQLIESLQSQQNISVNILVRDDGSRDKTLEILENYKKAGVLDYYADINKGAVNSFLNLIEAVPLNYDYYAFCDQDDVWENDKLSYAVDMLAGLDDKPALYYSGQKTTDSNLKMLYEHRLDPNRSIHACFIFNQMAGCTAVFNTELLKILKDYHPQDIFGHDVWCYKVCAAFGGNIVVESQGHILYRQHGSNVVGLENSIPGKILRARQYVNKYRPSTYAQELLNGYKSQLSESWIDFLTTICESNSKVRPRVSLIMDKRIRFNSVFLRGIYIVKAVLGKM